MVVNAEKIVAELRGLVDDVRNERNLVLNLARDIGKLDQLRQSAYPFSAPVRISFP